MTAPRFGELLPGRIVWDADQLDEHLAEAEARRAVAMRTELHLDLPDDQIRDLAEPAVQCACGCPTAFAGQCLCGSLCPCDPCPYCDRDTEEQLARNTT